MNIRTNKEPFRCTPSDREPARAYRRLYGRDQLTSEQRAELEELGLWDLKLEGSDSPLVLGVLEGQFGSGGIVSANTTLFPATELAEAVGKKRAEIANWRSSMKSGVPTGAVLGEGGHPSWGGGTYHKACVFLHLEMVQDPEFENVSHVRGRVAVLNTTAGRDISATRQIGGRVGASLRGFGRPQYMDLTDDLPWWSANPDSRGQEIVVVRDFEFDRDPFDLVDDPAMGGAWMESRMTTKRRNERNPQTQSTQTGEDQKLDEGNGAGAGQTEGESAESAESPEDQIESAVEGQAEGGEGDPVDATEAETSDLEGDDLEDEEGEDTEDPVEPEAAAEGGETAGGETAGDDSTQGAEASAARLREVEARNAELEQSVTRLSEEAAQTPVLAGQLATERTRSNKLAEELTAARADATALRAQVEQLKQKLTEAAANSARLEELAKEGQSAVVKLARSEAIAAFKLAHKLNALGLERVVTAAQQMPGYEEAPAEKLGEFLGFALNSTKSAASAAQPFITRRERGESALDRVLAKK